VAFQVGETTHLAGFSRIPVVPDADAFRAGVTTRLRSLPEWKCEADFLFVQVSFSVEQLLAWREGVQFDGDVYAGVMVLPSVSMARKLMTAIVSGRTI
jgi:methylenetetrahydrofolate reductase (NADPH)